MICQKKNFIHRNEGFQCLQCGFQNASQQGNCRNHCRKCFFSRHVDEEVPGDRKSHCNALMKPVGFDYSGKKGQIIIHQCLRCGKIMRNKMAKDDDQESLLSLYMKNL